MNIFLSFSRSLFEQTKCLNIKIYLHQKLMNDLPVAADSCTIKWQRRRTTQLELSEVEINNMSHWINEWQKVSRVCV